MSPPGDSGGRRNGNGAGHQPVLFVVEDDASTLELMREVAQDAGWAAFGFTRLGEVRTTLQQRHPTMLILDDDLPDGRGGDLARELRDDPTMHDLPTLVCSAAHPRRLAEIEGWVPVMSKPFDIAEFERFLRAAARREMNAQHRAAG